ncbi:hypothetical protein [Acidithiobacillus ferriphilus]|uniref:hypothetical protein n=1 Tax=Acidithiobacillus ferriphilus TaxID=1689834 RepID=UPI001C0640BE|nr:hypothetical protein [Acidithiobacillus ferriphilus]
MNYILSILLMTAIAYNFYLIFHGLKRNRRIGRFISNPESLTYILQYMTHTVEKDGDWAKLEAMRNDVRRSLRDIDNLRHDVSNKSLRDSKKTLELSKNEGCKS